VRAGERNGSVSVAVWDHQLGGRSAVLFHRAILSTSLVSVAMDAAASENVFAGSVAEFVKKWAECDQA